MTACAFFYAWQRIFIEIIQIHTVIFLKWEMKSAPDIAEIKL